MNVGGVEKALLGLLSVLQLDKYEVHVGLLKKDGGFLDFLPKEVIVHEINCYTDNWKLINDPPLRNIKTMLKKGQLVDAVVHFLLYVQIKLTSNRFWFYKYILRKEDYFPVEFDLAVSFAGPSQIMDYYICEKVNANKKCCWIHFDVSQYGIDKKMTAILYKRFDSIFIVSEEGKIIFDKLFPQFAAKTEVFHNVVSQENVISLAEVGPSFEDDSDVQRILTVGRISEEKGQQVAIVALKLLLDRGYVLKWYFVGDGDNRDYCEQLAEENGIKDNVVFLGVQTNPYGYMKDCDVYVQPSRHEGFCITVAEASCFDKPIVATDFTGANEQLKHRDNGLVVGMSAEDISKGVIEALEKGPSCSKQIQANVDLPKLLNLLL